MALSSSKATDTTTSVTPTQVGSVGVNLTAGTKLSIGKNSSLTVRTGLTDTDKKEISNAISGALNGASLLAANAPASSYTPLGGGGGGSVTIEESSPPPQPGIGREIFVGLVVIIAAYFFTR